MITGSGETNTHIQIIEGLVDRLIELGKPFDYMVYPNRDHGLREGEGTPVHVRMLIIRYGGGGAEDDERCERVSASQAGGRVRYFSLRTALHLQHGSHKVLSPQRSMGRPMKEKPTWMGLVLFVLVLFGCRCGSEPLPPRLRLTAGTRQLQSPLWNPPNWVFGPRSGQHYSS